MEHSESPCIGKITEENSEGCENSSSDSGSQEQEDAFESPANKIELPEVLHRRSDRKAQFRGFYLQQMTLVQTDSTDSLLGRQDQDMDKTTDENKGDTSGEVKIPAIVEDLVTKSDDENELYEGDTECSELKINNGIHDLHLDSLDVVYDTSDEDLSDKSPKPVKRRLRVSLKNLGDSDDEKCSDDSVLTPAKNAVNRMSDNEEAEEEAVTDESDVEVTGMDYYKIRHQADRPVTTEYSLSWSPKKFKAIREELVPNIPRNQRGLKLPNYPSIDIPSNFKLDDCNDEEDIPCKEEDFMSLDDFLEAHRTDFELSKANLSPTGSRSELATISLIFEAAIVRGYNCVGILSDSATDISFALGSFSGAFTVDGLHDLESLYFGLNDISINYVRISLGFYSICLIIKYA